MIRISLFFKNRNQRADALRLFFLAIEPAVENLQEDPLCPAIVFGIACLHLAAPVVAEANVAQLSFEVVDVIGRRHRGVDAVLQRILLGRQTESIEAHGVQDVEALHAFEARHNIRGDVAQRVTYMQASPGWVGKHVEHIVFRFGSIVADFINLFFDPGFAPFLFNSLDLVFRVFGHSNAVLVFRTAKITEFVGF